MRKAKNKMARHSNKYKRTYYKHDEMGWQRANNMEKCYRGCGLGSDMTRRQTAINDIILNAHTFIVCSRTIGFVSMKP